jgi:hypothetical protein
MSANQHTSPEAEAAVRWGFLFPVFICLLFLLVLAGYALPLGEDWRLDVKKSEEPGTNTYILNYDLRHYVPVPTAGEDLASYIPAPVTGGTAVVSGSGYTGAVEWAAMRPPPAMAAAWGARATSS